MLPEGIPVKRNRPARPARSKAQIREEQPENQRLRHKKIERIIRAYYGWHDNQPMVPGQHVLPGGKSLRQVAKEHHISPNGVKYHIDKFILHGRIDSESWNNRSRPNSIPCL